MTYQLTNEVILDNCNKCYKNIIIINKIPPDLGSIIKTIRRQKLSIFKWDDPCDCKKPCLFAIMDQDNLGDFLCMDNIANLFTYLSSKGYTINDKITKIMNKKNNKIICFISK